MSFPALSPVPFLPALVGVFATLATAAPTAASAAPTDGSTFALFCRHSTRTDVGWLHVGVTPEKDTVTYAGHYDYYKGNVDDVDVGGSVGPVDGDDVYALRDAKVTVTAEGDVLTVKAVSWLTHGRAPHEETVVATFGGYEPGKAYVYLSSFLVDGKKIYPGSGVCSLNGDVVLAP